MFLTKHWDAVAAPVTAPQDEDGPRRRVLVLATEETRDLAWALDRHLPARHEVVVREVDGATALPDPRWDKVDGWIDLTGCGTAPAPRTTGSRCSSGSSSPAAGTGCGCCA
ncbi:hypothetical protein O1L55_09735 [Streptomyces albulus]|nr:hypothetical protein [Streptomyces noursei]